MQLDFNTDRGDLKIISGEDSHLKVELLQHILETM